MRDPRYKALLIGCGTFDRDPHKLAPLKGPANDVRLMREALAHPQAGLFEPANIKHMLDANKDEMLEAIEMFFNDAGVEDHLFFYYSGHGYPDTNNNLYLCARNTRTNLLGSSAVPDREINSMAENSRARKFIFVLDCCHSGGFKGGTAGLSLAHGSGRCLITSCASDQLSADAGTPDGASTFTHHLAQALTSGEVDSDGDGVVLTSELFKDVQPRVYAATKQTVQWTMDKTFGEAAIACATPRPRAAEPAGPGGAAEPAVTQARPQPPAGRPVLEVSETRIEFRDVQPGETLPVERLDVFNSGDGSLDWAHECDEPWIAVERQGDSLMVRLDTAEPGLRRGNLFVRDRGRGGSRTVRVLLHVVAPEAPRLVASPTELDFGTSLPGATPRREVRVSNAGRGRLEWEIDEQPGHLEVERSATGFFVFPTEHFYGDLAGRITLKGNGGAATIVVRGTVQETAHGSPHLPPPIPPPPDPLAQALVGWWMNDSGALHIRLEGGALVYSDHNLLGVNVGQGSVRCGGGVAVLQGSNTFVGNYTAQVSVQGAMLTGQIQNALGQVFPLMFMRQQPWFAAFVS